MLLSYWFEIRSCDVTGRRARLPAKGARIRATRIAARSKSSCFSLISFGTLVALRSRRPNAMARDLPCWERDVGTRQAVIEECETCVETRFEHR